MKVISSIPQMQSWSKRMRRQGKTIGFVPTMGYLHEGHLTLIQRARRENDLVVVSIFVNPTQFGPKEDFKRYPRDFTRDKKLCKLCGVDVIFYPRVHNMYPDGYKTYVQVKELSQVLCGAFRPGHFHGVATVVSKLFHLVQPDSAYFGQKDAQQAAIIKRMAVDLNFPLKIKVLPIVREQDGLAMSSRNIYLSRKQRENAIILYNALQTAVGMIKSGCHAPRKIIGKMRKMIKSKPDSRIDYIKIVQFDNLKESQQIKGHILIAVAVFFGQVRLIDNVSVSI